MLLEVRVHRSHQHRSPCQTSQRAVIRHKLQQTADLSTSQRLSTHCRLGPIRSPYETGSHLNARVIAQQSTPQLTSAMTVDQVLPTNMDVLSEPRVPCAIVIPLAGIDLDRPSEKQATTIDVNAHCEIAEVMTIVRSAWLHETPAVSHYESPLGRPFGGLMETVHAITETLASSNANIEIGSSCASDPHIKPFHLLPMGGAACILAHP